MYVYVTTADFLFFFSPVNLSLACLLRFFLRSCPGLYGGSADAAAGGGGGNISRAVVGRERKRRH